MKPKIHNRLSLFLIAGSLGLLLVFLWLWLQKVYEEEYAALKKEADYLFINSIREIEDQYFNKFLVEPISIQVVDSALQHTGNVKVIRQVDSTRNFSLIDKRTSHWQSDSTVQLTFRSNLMREEEKRGFQGSLSLFVALAAEGDSLLPAPATPEVLPLLREKFATDMQESGLPGQYEIIQLPFDSIHTHRILVSSTYQDVASGKEYAVEFSGYRQHLLRKMTPHLLFALLLFGCVSLAFYLIYQSLQKQRRLTMLKNDFISNVTHELKTPITTVGVAIEALSDFNALADPQRTREYLDISRHELSRLSILVDKVLKMSLFEQSEPDLKLETVDLKLLVEEILNSMKLQFDKLAAKVQFQTDGALYQLQADRIHLTSVVYNLLDNALKYSREDPDIRISLEDGPQHIRLQVLDHGIGIPPEYREKIFDKFFRVPTGDRHDIKGHGLGLNYVAAVVRRHHGRIAVDSRPGQGACFTIELPKRHDED